MSVGLPGTGIGGVFYLLSALWMPFDGVLRAARGERPVRVQAIATQTLLAVGILAALFATGWLIEQLVSLTGWTMRLASGTTINGQVVVPKVLRTMSFVMSFGTLAAVWLSVQVLRVVYARPALPVQPEPEPEAVLEQNVA
jgi:hypothetical protein